MKKVLAVAVVSMVALTARAAITTQLIRIDLDGDPTDAPVTLSDGAQYYLCAMRVTTDTDWTNSRLDMELTSGSFYNHPFGGNGPATPNVVAVHPDLKADTHVSSSIPDLEEPISGLNLDASKAGVTMFTDTEIHVSWFDTQDGGPVTGATIARIALSLDASGTIAGKSYDVGTAGQGVPFEGVFVGGPPCQPPEPAALSLLALGSLALLRRRSNGKGRQRAAPRPEPVST